MRTRNFKRWVAGLCAATMLAGVPTMVGYAEQTGTKELTDMQSGDTTSVTAEVVQATPVTYVVAIPEQVDFGQIQQPNSAGTSYLNEAITVKCTQLDGHASGQTLAVYVKDSDAVDSTDPFKLKKEDYEDVVMTYSIINGEEIDLQNLSWYANGFLFGSFTAAGQSIENTLRLDKGQLYGKDMSIWGGKYTGTLQFTTRIASVADVQSMESDQPVV